VDSYALELVGKPRPKVTYIPSCSIDGEWEFKEFVDDLKFFGVTKFMYFPVDLPFDQVMLNEALSSDMIYLSGGNTYYFLYWLRRSRMLQRLKQYALDGGVLTGLSAGAIIMTPNIRTAGFPHFDRDDNEIGLKNEKSLGLVSFEFFPHYRNSKRYDHALAKMSRIMDRPLYASPDGSGIGIDGERITFIGRTHLFYQGKKISIKRDYLPGQAII
jgi:dipeptidase E